MDKVYSPHWMHLDADIRAHLRKVFSVGKSGITEVRDQTLITDGTTNEDLAHAFTKEAMCKYIGSEETFPRAWEITVSKAKYEVHPPINIPVREELLTPEAPITNPAQLLPPPTEHKFCEFCESKGIRHQKECQKPGLVNGFERPTPPVIPTTPNEQIQNI